jgi:hypothetical protein
MKGFDEDGEEEFTFKDWTIKEMKTELLKLIRKKYKMKVLRGVKVLIEDLV